MPHRALMAGLFAASLALAPALAQTAAPQAQSPGRTFDLTVTAADLQTMSRLLAKAPYEDVAPLFAKLQSQIQAQADRVAAGGRSAPAKPDPSTPDPASPIPGQAGHP